MVRPGTAAADVSAHIFGAAFGHIVNFKDLRPRFVELDRLPCYFRKATDIALLPLFLVVFAASQHRVVMIFVGLHPALVAVTRHQTDPKLCDGWVLRHQVRSFLIQPWTQSDHIARVHRDRPQNVFLKVNGFVSIERLETLRRHGWIWATQCRERWEEEQLFGKQALQKEA